MENEKTAPSRAAMNKSENTRKDTKSIHAAQIFREKCLEAHRLKHTALKKQQVSKVLTNLTRIYYV